MAEHETHDGHHAPDEWFRHTPAEGRPQPEHAAHVNSTAIGLTLLAVVFGVLFTVIVLSLYFVQLTTRLKAERQEGVGIAAPYLTYRQESVRDLSSFGWADREAGIVRLPIDRAMEDVVAFYGEPERRARVAWHSGKGLADAPPGAAVAMGDDQTDEE